MTTATKLVISVVVACGVVLAIRHARTEQVAVPGDMPASAKFLQSGFDVATNEPQGNWVACTFHSADGLDWCRVTDPKGTVLYEGDFLPVSSNQPLGNDQLIVASANPKKMWVRGPVEGGSPVPAIPLSGGGVLVPASDRYALLQRWAQDPTEYDTVRDTGTD